MSKFLPQNFNDFLALILIILIPLMWALQGANKLSFPTEVNGGLLVTWTLIIQFYYRRTPPKDGESK
jgi:hypothetical protein